MLNVKLAAAIISACAQFQHMGIMGHEKEVCDKPRRHYHFGSETFGCKRWELKKIIEWDNGDDMRGKCGEIYHDCIKTNSFKECKYGKWVNKSYPPDVWGMKRIIEEVRQFELYAPSEAMVNYRRENRFPWRQPKEYKLVLDKK